MSVPSASVQAGEGGCILQPLAEWLGELPQLIMLDLDGTLVDSAADIALSLNRALDELGLGQVSDALVRDGVGRGAARLMHYTLSHLRPHHGEDPQGHALESRLLAVFMRHYEASVCEASTVYPGVREFLAAAQSAGIALACVTNKPYRPAIALLDALDLLAPFALVIGGDSLTQRKPHPEPLQHCLRHFSVAPARALMVGDSRNDVDAAKAAGVPVLALPYGYNHGEPIEACAPDRLVASLAALL